MVNQIKHSVDKFELSLNGKVVLTEAASGNYVATPLIAALAGSYVVAITKDSKYASKEDVTKQTLELAKKLGVDKKIEIVYDYSRIPLDKMDVLTNTGFVRPINSDIIDKLSTGCVIPLMWEPWEYRSTELDLERCRARNIKVYGTNEKDHRLQTCNYVGFGVLNFLLNAKMSPFSTKVLILGGQDIAFGIIEVLKMNNYNYVHCDRYSESIDISDFQAIVVAEHSDSSLLIGGLGFIKKHEISTEQYIIHVCGNVDFKGLACKININSPANFGHMSFTADYVDSKAVVDLHAAGLKVAEGMLAANQLCLSGEKYKIFMESNYPALSFENERYW